MKEKIVKEWGWCHIKNKSLHLKHVFISLRQQSADKFGLVTTNKFWQNQKHHLPYLNTPTDFALWNEKLNTLKEIFLCHHEFSTHWIISVFSKDLLYNINTYQIWNWFKLAYRVCWTRVWHSSKSPRFMCRYENIILDHCYVEELPGSDILTDTQRDHVSSLVSNVRFASSIMLHLILTILF